MKTILILGDSWAVPNYPDEMGRYLLGDKFNTHTEFLLKELGYNVINCGLNGVSNEASFRFGAHKILETSLRVDVVIWFHTEALRNQTNYLKNSLMKDILYNSYRKTYEICKDFLLQIKPTYLIVIGGQSPIYKPLFYNYFKPNFIIEDWRSQLIGNKLPEIHWLTDPSWIENSADTLDEKNKMLDISQLVMKKMLQSDLFPDNGHPGANAHARLTNTLHHIIQNFPQEVRSII